jgi:hypothetical protein
MLLFSELSRSLERRWLEVEFGLTIRAGSVLTRLATAAALFVRSSASLVTGLACQFQSTAQCRFSHQLSVAAASKHLVTPAGLTNWQHFMDLLSCSGTQKCTSAALTSSAGARQLRIVLRCGHMIQHNRLLCQQLIDADKGPSLVQQGIGMRRGAWWLCNAVLAAAHG